ncbi:MAG: NAD(P)(+) transhydrogenase (Re/Si-specific) subunit alpha, partial [Proteobacteria bacterium]|nr:NAD(P)(+) transhydrogenase (Re/Si-specific) subunit alpha [Pseudomonadota bacterium]
MRVAITREAADEPRVSASPDTVKKLVALGLEVAVEPGAGTRSGVSDADFSAAGAKVADDAAHTAEIVLKVRRPSAAEAGRYRKGAVVIAIMDPYGQDAALEALA